MPIFDSEYSEIASLRDDTKVLLRLVRPSDKPLFNKGLEQLSSDSRYRRFMSPKNALSERELAFLTEMDQQDHFAIGAQKVDDCDQPLDEGLGVARFFRMSENPQVAEAAVVVIDEMQGNGLGRMLLLRLVAAALERDVSHFHCEMLATNEAIKSLLLDMEPQAEIRRQGTVVEIELDLPEVTSEALSHDGWVPPGPLYRVFSAFALGQLKPLQSRLAVQRKFAQTPKSGSSPAT